MTRPEPTAWAHLPNARHIDGILADAQARPERWCAAWRAAWDATPAGVWSAAWTTAGGTAWISAGGSLSQAVWRLGQCEGRNNVRDAIIALSLWPASARMLSMTPAALRTLIDITEGDVKHQAVLILPAVLAGYVPTEGDYQWT